MPIKPIIMVVDDEPAPLTAMRDDLARRYGGRQARQAHISVPLHGFFQAAKQQVSSVRIHLAELRAIEHNGRTLSLQDNGEFLEHGTFNAVVDALRQVFDGDAACFEYHCGLTPSTNVGVST